jgi:hypothetical protein
MPSTYYDLEVGADGILMSSPSPAAPNPMPVDANTFLTRLRGAFDRARLRIPDSAARTPFANYLLTVGQLGLQEGNLETANKELAGLDEAGGHVHYYSVNLDDDQTLHLAAPPWAPHPMPDDVTVFAGRVDKAISKVKRLIQAPDKRAQYLRTVSSHAERGLQEGDIKNASAALDQFEKQFVEEEGPAFRAKYVASTLRTALYVLGCIVMLSILYTLIKSTWPSTWPTLIPWDEKIIPTALAVAFGICLGVSFFAFVRNLNLTFDQLGNFDPANLSAVLRFSLVGIIAVILCVLLSAGLVKVDIAGVKFEEYMNQPLTAIILGMICGYSDAAITRTLTGVLDRK